MMIWSFEIRPALGPDGKEEVVATDDSAYDNFAPPICDRVWATPHS